MPTIDTIKVVELMEFFTSDEEGALTYADFCEYITNDFTWGDTDHALVSKDYFLMKTIRRFEKNSMYPARQLSFWPPLKEQILSLPDDVFISL